MRQRRGMVGSLAVLIAVATIMAGCQPPSPAATVPPAIAPVLKAWHDAGLVCGDPHVGMPENTPQWICQGSLEGVQLTVATLGDNRSVMDMEAQVAPSTPARSAASVFSKLVEVTPAFVDRRGEIVVWISSWDGKQSLVMKDLPDVHLALSVDRTWITFSLSRIPYFTEPPAARGS